MAVNQLRYAQKYEQLVSQGVPEAQAHEQAVEFATTKPTQQAKRRKSPLAKAIVWGGRKGRELWGGPKTYLHETPEERRKRVKLEKEA